MVISLEEALGLPVKAALPKERLAGYSQAPERQDAQKQDLKILTRRIRVFELRCQGLTIARICEKLRENGLEASERTVWDDLHSPQAQELVDELTRQQLEDIANLKKPSSRLHWRDVLLEKLMPKKGSDKVEVNVNASAQSTAQAESTASLLAEYDALIAQEMAKETSNISKNYSAEQVHQTQASDSA